MLGIVPMADILNANADFNVSTINRYTQSANIVLI
jgi:hypothetical protein